MPVVRSTWATRRLCIASLVWVLVLLGFHWGKAELACKTDTSYCALSGDKNGTYRATLTDPSGRTLANTPFVVRFESRRSASPRYVGGFSSDSSGEYCIRWARESVRPAVRPAGGVEVPIMADWQPLNGAAPPPRCQAGDEGIPWNRADDLKSTWQYISVVVTTLASIALLAVGLLPRAVPGTTRLREAGNALAVVATATAVLVWSV